MAFNRPYSASASADLMALYQQGISTAQKGHFLEAIQPLEKFVQLNQQVPQVHKDLGYLYRKVHQYDKALTAYTQAIRLAPDYLEAYESRGNLRIQLNQPDAALADFDKAISLKPDYANAYYNRGLALAQLKQMTAAIDSFHTSFSLEPDFYEAHYNHGVALQSIKQYTAALASFDKTIHLKPDLVDAYYNRGLVLLELKQLNAALVNFEKVLSINPDYDFLWGVYVDTKMRLCDWSTFERDMAVYEKNILSQKKVAHPFMALSVLDKPELHLILSKVYAATRHSETLEKVPFTRGLQEGKIRLAYYSSDFHNHATSALIAELFERHNRDRFELYGFSLGPQKYDNMRQRVSASFTRFIDISELSDADVSQLSRTLGIDIAIDLNGYTTHERPGMFAQGCAPVQATFLGSPGTMGADYNDYIVADHIVITPENEPSFTEKIVFLPDSYQVNDSQRKISDRIFTREELELPASGFVYCCFNSSHKLLPDTFAGWMRILRSVKGSVLWVLGENVSVIQNLLQQAQAQGVDASRIVFAQRVSPDDNLARQKLADLFLDTFPYNAHTTASDALWAGLPVLTRTGLSFASRVAASLLAAIKLPELITHSQEAYEQKAIELAQQPELLKALKQKLVANQQTTPLFDCQLFTKHIESAYEEMHRRHRAGLPADHLHVQLVTASVAERR
jgi:predicted O-linked N-acetylglucosamine transferase (SPINDLY family)